MLKLIVYLFNFISLSTFLFALFTLGYWCVLTMDVSVPESIIDYIEHHYEPFRTLIVEIFGEHTQIYKNRVLEMTYGILTVCLLCVFLVSLLIGSIFSTIDHKISSFVDNKVSQVKKAKRQLEESKVIRTSEGNIWIPETGAAVAIRLENVEYYPDLDNKLREKIESLDLSQQVFSIEEKFILTFSSTMSAILFLLEFVDIFRKTSVNMKYKLDKEPIIKCAVQSLKEDGIFAEEGFLWALLNCVGPNEIYLGVEAKEQFDMQKQSMSFHKPIKIIRVGTYSQLGHRTFADVFRLSLPDDDYKEAG